MNKPEKVPAITPAQFSQLLERAMPSAHAMNIQPLSIGYGTATLLLPADKALVRPGGTLAGPTLFGLADIALYAAVLGALGLVVEAVTTSMHIDFLRRPKIAAVRAEARLLKLGKRLAVGDVLLFTEGDDEPIARASGTYAIPQATDSVFVQAR